jgi:hypothetical protein
MLRRRGESPYVSLPKAKPHCLCVCAETKSKQQLPGEETRLPRHHQQQRGAQMKLVMVDNAPETLMKAYLSNCSSGLTRHLQPSFQTELRMKFFVSAFTCPLLKKVSKNLGLCKTLSKKIAAS